LLWLGGSQTWLAMIPVRARLRAQVLRIKTATTLSGRGGVES
jgi:hypothetical protein